MDVRKMGETQIYTAKIYRGFVGPYKQQMHRKITQN
jgi:hypothetical protein